MNKKDSIKIAEYVEASQKEIDNLGEKVAVLSDENKKLKMAVSEKGKVWNDNLHKLADVLTAKRIISEDKANDFVKSATEDKNVLIRFVDRLVNMVEYTTFGKEAESGIETGGGYNDAYEYLAYHGNLNGWKK